MREQMKRHIGTIVVASVVATVASGGTAIAIVANAHKIDGYHANQLVRATRQVETATLNNFDPAAFATVVSTTAEAPRNGILVIWAGANVEWDDGSDPNSVGFLRGRVLADGAGTDIEVDQVLQDPAFGGYDSHVMDWSVAVPVSKGPHLVELQMRLFDGTPADATSFIRDRWLTILFVPFGNSGEAGVLAPVASSALEGQSSNVR